METWWLAGVALAIVGGCGHAPRATETTPPILKEVLPEPKVKPAAEGAPASLKQGPLGTAVREAGLNPDDLQECAKGLGCLVVRGGDAMEIWQKLRRPMQRQGYWPVVAGEPTRVRELALPAPPTVEKALQGAAQLDLARWREDRRASDPEYYSASEGTWPRTAVVSRVTGSLLAHTDPLNNRPLPEVAIVLVKAANSYEVPAILGWGGWNNCPEAAVHVAQLREWNRRFGAELYSLTLDTLEVTIERPVETREAALALAREQYMYCEDLVHQGAETLNNLAASLLGARAWHFWWD